ncbi:TolC family protein [Desulfotomaculum sp. 1211_IL3151]|uniref:TolC family protein n=1 Tax=Desulfotomaculum sp. 1211_IL3151 TaxID=3084055 RepID=UPI002FDA2BD1
MRLKIQRYIWLTLLLTLTLTVPAFAQDNTADPSLDLNQAIKKALAHSATIKNQQLSIDQNEIQRDNAQQAMKYIPTSYDYNPEDTNTFKAFYGVDFEYRKGKKKLEADKRQVVVDVTKAYYEVIKKKTALEEKKLTQAKNIIKLGQTNAKAAVGMITAADILAAETAVAADRAAIKEADMNLENSYSNLNRLIGQDLAGRPILTDAIVFAPSGIKTDEQVLKAINNSYEMWTANEGAKLASLTKYFEYWSDIGIKSEAQAHNAASDTREGMKVQVEELCHGILALEEKYIELDKQLQQLQENLRVIKIQYEQGLVTRDAVLSVEELLKKIENGKLEVASTHAVSLKSLYRLTGELSVIPAK